MKRHVMAALLIVSAASNAQQIGTRAHLNALLVGSGRLDDFETFVVPDGMVEGGYLTTLDSSTIFRGQGPGLVNPGASYSGGERGEEKLAWNGNQYYGIASKTLEFYNTQWETITYKDFTQAAGIDVTNFEGFAESGEVEFYDLRGNRVGMIRYRLSGAANERVFLGWRHDAGLSGMTLYNFYNQWAPVIDDHQYGVVPEPAIVIALGAALTALAARRRNK